MDCSTTTCSPSLYCKLPNWNVKGISESLNASKWWCVVPQTQARLVRFQSLLTNSPNMAILDNKLLHGTVLHASNFKQIFKMTKLSNFWWQISSKHSKLASWWVYLYLVSGIPKQSGLMPFATDGRMDKSWQETPVPLAAKDQNKNLTKMLT